MELVKTTGKPWEKKKIKRGGMGVIERLNREVLSVAMEAETK